LPTITSLAADQRNRPKRRKIARRSYIMHVIWSELVES